MTTRDAQKYMSGYQDGYSAAIEDAILLYQSDPKTFIDELRYWGIAVIESGITKLKGM